MTSKVKINIEESTIDKTDLAWKVILFNCDCHSFDEVILQLMRAIGCSHATGSQFANVIDQMGSAAVFNGSKVKCEAVADILMSIGLSVQVTQ